VIEGVDCLATRNVIANGQSAVQHCPIGVSWLPSVPRHGIHRYYITQPFWEGSDTASRPSTSSGAPRSGWDDQPSQGHHHLGSELRVRLLPPEDKLPDEGAPEYRPQLAAAHVERAEPVRPDTFRRFRERFQAYGLRPRRTWSPTAWRRNTLAVFAPRPANPYRQQACYSSSGRCITSWRSRGTQPDPTGQLRETTRED